MEGEKMKKFSKKIVLGFVLAMAFLFTITASNANAGAWQANILKCTVETDINGVATYYVLVQQTTTAYQLTLNFTNKEMLATALSTISLNASALVKWDNVTLEMYYLQILP
jgi:hypothetical protein